MENLRSLEPQAKISHSYKKKECNSSHTISSLIFPKDAAMQVDIGLPYSEDSDE